MSGNGRLRALMEARRREELRKQRVREQCTNLLNNLEKKLQQCESNANYAYFVAEKSSSIREQWQKAQQLMRTDPDTALVTVQDTIFELNEAVSSAVASEKQWSAERQSAEQLLESTIDDLKSMPLKDQKGKTQLKALVDSLQILKETATSAEQLQKEIKQIEGQAVKIQEEDEEVEVRKEIVRNILIALKKQGFIVGKPKLKAKIVHVTGKLPSGKTVLFQVHEDTNIDFELEGYSGTTCKQEIDGVLEKINTEGNVKAAIDQFVWHNPDKIRKGAKDYPTGMVQVRHMKK